MKVGDPVIKTSGDYRFIGFVVAVFTKLDKKSVRVVVENGDGVLHIFNANQLEPIVDRPFNPGDAAEKTAG